MFYCGVKGVTFSGNAFLGCRVTHVTCSVSRNLSLCIPSGSSNLHIACRCLCHGALTDESKNRCQFVTQGDAGFLQFRPYAFGQVTPVAQACFSIAALQGKYLHDLEKFQVTSATQLAVSILSACEQVVLQHVLLSGCVCFCMSSADTDCRIWWRFM